MVIKYVNRMLFAFIAALGLFMVYNFTDSTVRKNEIRKEALIAIENDDLNFFVPFRYYNSQRLVDEIIETEDHTLHIMIYEVVMVSSSVSSGDYVFRDGLFFLMKMIEGPNWGEYYSVKLTASNNQQEEYLGFRLLDLPVFSAMNPDTAIQFMDRSLFKTGDNIMPITQIDLFLEGVAEPYVSIPVNFTNERFIVKDQVINYYEAEGKLPIEAFENVSISERLVIDSTLWVLINSSIYLVVVGILTAFIFTYKKKNLGRKKSTIGVQLDIERLGLKDTKK